MHARSHLRKRRRARRAVRRTVLPAVAALLLTGAVLGPSSPAAAFSVQHWTFEGPSAGMPTTDVAARTIEAATVSMTDGPDGEQVDASVTLGAIPESATEGRLHLVTGIPDGDRCAPVWEWVVPTSSARTDESGAAVVQVDYPVEAADWQQGSCVYVSVTSVDAATVYDRWDGTYGGEEIGDPGGLVRIKDVHVPDGVRPHRWFPVRVELKNVQSDLDRVRVSGSGVDLRAAPTVLGGMRSGESLTTRLWVRLQAPYARRLRIVTTPYGAIAFPMQDTQMVTIRPR